VSEEEQTRYIVFNEQNQPVELQFGDRVIIVPPLDQIELAENEVFTPQLQALSARSLITMQVLEPEASIEEETETGGDEESTSEGEATRQPRKRKQG
jgi:hypothetical protein